MKKLYGQLLHGGIIDMNRGAEKTDSRCVNFDLLKIVLMYGIVVFHIVSIGGGYNQFKAILIKI